MRNYPLISIIIPVYNAAQDLKLCLQTLKKSSYNFYEILVIDDGSTDESAAVAKQAGASVFSLKRRSGPAAARNRGVEKAKGKILLFIDSDVLVKEETIFQVADRFITNPELDALFGSYDDSPLQQNFLSQYKNLLHHFVHQMSSSDAATFWAGCGAVRKNVFHSVGGFDEKKYLIPCIEDIELGYRMKKLGCRILLDKNIQVTHSKKWTLLSLLRTDILHRAIPWTKLILESREMFNDLNLQLSQKISTALTALIIVLLLLSILNANYIVMIPIPLSIIIIINHKLFRFLLRRKGLLFTLVAFFMHLIYYFYIGVVFSVYWLSYKLRT